MGVVVREMTKETRMAVERVTANSRIKRPTMPPISKIGVNTATSEMLMDRTVKATSRAPLRAASRGDMPMFGMAGDVFDDDNGVVHDESSGNDQRHQGKIVQAVAKEIHHAKRADEGSGHDNGRERGSCVDCGEK